MNRLLLFHSFTNVRMLENRIFCHHVLSFVSCYFCFFLLSFFLSFLHFTWLFCNAISNPLVTSIHELKTRKMITIYKRHKSIKQWVMRQKRKETMGRKKRWKIIQNGIAKLNISISNFFGFPLYISTPRIACGSCVGGVRSTLTYKMLFICIWTSSFSCVTLKFMSIRLAIFQTWKLFDLFLFYFRIRMSREIEMKCG